MRSLLKYYLPLLLTLLIPLGLLAWFGSQELTRLETRTMSVLQEEAHRFLTKTENSVRTEIQRLAHRALSGPAAELFADPKLSIVEISSQIDAEPFVLQAFVADPEFNLIAPRVPRVREPSAPLAKFPSEQDSDARELLQADVLQSLGDDEGAMELLSSYIRRFRTSDRHEIGLAWAYLRLAGLNAKNRDDPDTTLELYYSARVQAERGSRRKATEDFAAVILLSQLRMAQINFDSGELTRLVEALCTGRQAHIEYLAEDLIQTVLGRIHQDIEIPAPLLALNQVRAAGRRFARSYELRAQRRLRAQYRNHRKPSYKGVIFHAVSTDEGSRLVALRPASEVESERFDGGAAWVGLLLDLPAMVGRILGNETGSAGNMALAVSDPYGSTLLANDALPPSDDTALNFAPVVSPLADLEFVAIATVDPADLQRTTRNQLVMGLILLVIAATGGFMLIRAVRRETELAQTKMLLLSRVSHELKTPLAVIKMYGETIGRGRTKEPGQLSRFAGIISNEADRLTGMVERILDFSKMEAGTFDYQRQDFDLCELVEDVTSEYEPHIEAQGMHLNLDLTADLPVHADPRACASSLVSLLENSLKYSPEDSTDRSIDVSLERADGQAILTVRDHGIGIPEAELGNVFNDFFRASNAGEIRGAGLGLSLVRHFALAHGGRIEALVPEGGGTAMRLTLPLAQPEPSRTE